MVKVYLLYKAIVALSAILKYLKPNYMYCSFLSKRQKLLSGKMSYREKERKERELWAWRFLYLVETPTDLKF